MAGPRSSHERRRARREAEDMKQILLLAGDAVCTAIFVLLTSTFAQARGRSRHERLDLRPTAVETSCPTAL
jgi:hypothetical protein